MKRSGPIQRKTPMKRGGRISPVSEKRKAEQGARTACRAEVLRRSEGRCEYEAVIDWIPCGFLPDRRALEVDELRGGSFRSTEYLDPDACRATCPVHHDYKTSHKNEVLALLEAHESPKEP